MHWLVFLDHSASSDRLDGADVQDCSTHLSELAQIAAQIVCQEILAFDKSAAEVLLTVVASDESVAVLVFELAVDILLQVRIL